MSWWAFLFFAQVHQGEFPVIPSRLVLLLFRRSRLAIRSRVRVASLRSCAPLTAQVFAAPFRCDGGSGGNDNSIELANGAGMDAVLIARYSLGMDASALAVIALDFRGVPRALGLGRVELASVVGASLLPVA